VACRVAAGHVISMSSQGLREKRASPRSTSLDERCNGKKVVQDVVKLKFRELCLWLEEPEPAPGNGKLGVRTAEILRLVRRASLGTDDRGVLALTFDEKQAPRCPGLTFPGWSTILKPSSLMKADTNTRIDCQKKSPTRGDSNQICP
jgi:hypothetical protein